VPAVAVTQRERVISNWNRLKGCVGASFELVHKFWVLTHWLTFYLWKWNIISGLRELLVVEIEFRNINRNTGIGEDTRLDNIDSDARKRKQ